MSVLVQPHVAGFLTYTLTSGQDVLVISAFGGQIPSWTKQGVPILFANASHAIVDGKTPYRGGAPVCFPYFGKGTLLPLGTTLNPQHGNARTSIWDVRVMESENAIALRTVQSSGEGYGPTSFECELVYRLSDKLETESTIRNVGQFSAPFQFAVHAYWATTEPAQAVVSGLGHRYLDNLLGYTEYVDTQSSEPHVAPVDRVYCEAADSLELETNNYKLQISTQGCQGTVLWNPGAVHTLKDLGSPDFICVESGVVVPSVNLAPGSEHAVRISYLATIT